MLMLIKSIATHYFYFNVGTLTLTTAILEINSDFKPRYICTSFRMLVLNSYRPIVMLILLENKYITLNLNRGQQGDNNGYR